MAPNSLFAILLRSPWWISLALALAFVAVPQALLPPEYRLFAAMGGLPFLIIAGIALWRQIRAPSAQEAQALIERAHGMAWAEFSDALVRGFTRQGYTVERTGASGADLVLRRAGQTTLVSARRWKAAHHGQEALQALHRQARTDDATHTLYVALGALSSQAQRFAAQQQVQVLGQAQVVELLRS